jgi:outer membrane protein assembly factor BamB
MNMEPHQPRYPIVNPRAPSLPKKSETIAATRERRGLFFRMLFFIVPLFLSVSCDNDSRTTCCDHLNWRLFRGNTCLSGYTDICLPAEPTLLWTYNGAERTVSSPVIDNGITYWCDKRGRISGVNLEGELAFEYDMETAVEATPMIYDSTLYIGRIDGFMTALSLAKRDTIWTFETMGQIAASPNIMKINCRKAVVFGSYDNFMYCVDAKNGETLNRFESGYYLNGAAALWKGHVVFGGCDSWIRVIDCETGVQTDSLLLDAYIPASPAIMGDYCYVGDYSGNIYKLMLQDGKIVRHKKIVAENNDSGSFVSVPAISSEAFFFFSGERYLHAISRINGKQLWKYMLKGNAGESSPVVCNDKILVCTKTGIVSILDINNGELLWEYDTGEQIVGSPAVIKNHFMILTAKGTLFCFGKKNR